MLKCKHVQDVELNNANMRHAETACLYVDMLECKHVQYVELNIASMCHADMDLLDDQGCSAVHCAVKARQLEVVQLLLEHGADVDSE